MKKKILIIITSILSYFIFCENFSIFTTNESKYGYSLDVYSCLESMYLYEDGTAKFSFDDFRKLDDFYMKYSICHINGMSFLKFTEKLPDTIYEYPINGSTDDKIMFLAGRDKDGRVTMFSYTKGFPFDLGSFTFSRYINLGSTFYDCSSYLVEKQKEYSIKNLQKYEPDTPWVEGVPGYGIGEGFSIWRSKAKYILMMNGYISYDKPYLYEQNSRVKKIKVEHKKSGEYIFIDVLDTPHPQSLDISTIPEGDIRVTIADVYPGTKYDDTCIHYIFCCNDYYEPYELFSSDSSGEEK